MRLKTELFDRQQAVTIQHLREQINEVVTDTTLTDFPCSAVHCVQTGHRCCYSLLLKQGELTGQKGNEHLFYHVSLVSSLLLLIYSCYLDLKPQGKANILPASATASQELGSCSSQEHAANPLLRECNGSI